MKKETKKSSSPASKGKVRSKDLAGKKSVRGGIIAVLRKAGGKQQDFHF